MKERHFKRCYSNARLLVLAICVVAVLSGCSGRAEKFNVKREIPALPPS